MTSASNSPDPSDSRVRIDTFTLGPYQTNCYVVSAPGPGGGGRPCWIVDASFSPTPMIEHVRDQGLSPEAIVLTHAHIDHIAGVRDMLAAFPDLPIWIHRNEEDWLTDAGLNLSEVTGWPVTTPPASRLLTGGDRLTLGGSTWAVLETPGHSPGGITLHSADLEVAIVGDALFAGSIGRTDFPGSDHELLIASIRDQLFPLPGQTTVLPGHGPATTIEHERAANPFVRSE